MLSPFYFEQTDLRISLFVLFNFLDSVTISVFRFFYLSIFKYLNFSYFSGLFIKKPLKRLVNNDLPFINPAINCGVYKNNTKTKTVLTV